MDASTITTGPRGWGKRISQAALFLGIAGAVLALGGGLLAWSAVVAPIKGFTWFGYGVMAAFGALVVSLIALCIHAVRKSAALRSIGLAWLLAAPLVGYAVFFISQARAVPPIHDVTTDLANPPQFATLKLREDLNKVVPDGGRAELTELTPAQRRAKLHAEAYGDLKTFVVPMTVAEAVEKLTAQAKARGWEVAVSDPAAGRVEATERVSLFRFADDIVFRVQPDPNNPARVYVDARSVSRVGVSDVGVNARRIRAALDEFVTR